MSVVSVKCGVKAGLLLAAAAAANSVFSGIAPCYGLMLEAKTRRAAGKCVKSEGSLEVMIDPAHGKKVDPDMINTDDYCARSEFQRSGACRKTGVCAWKGDGECVKPEGSLKAVPYPDDSEGIEVNTETYCARSEFQNSVACRKTGVCAWKGEQVKFDVGENVVGIDHVSRVISDVDASVQFYTSLGFTQVKRPFDELDENKDDLNGAWMEIGTGNPSKQQGPLLHLIKDKIGAVVEALHYAKGNLGDVQHIALRLGVDKFKSVLDNYNRKIAESKEKILKASASLWEEKALGRKSGKSIDRAVGRKPSNLRRKDVQSKRRRAVIKQKEKELEGLKKNAPNVSIKTIPFNVTQVANLKKVGVDIPERSNGEHSIIQIWLPDPDGNYVEICDCNAGSMADEIAKKEGVSAAAIKETKSGTDLITEPEG